MRERGTLPQYYVVTSRDIVKYRVFRYLPTKKFQKKVIIQEKVLE